ncbi:hypothetical protein MAF45_10995 [Mesosutterella sp. OilRF-GAM-744-9]|uniref:Uncharacterized protein n=1 Tax=Mesosutterella porci TaxID=2915351 RepID=A0ABS9MTJ7_9BURK|nr:hypothetical protein [Mesosutterella sp. oilRF-744-WT-GAM-9]
MEKRTELFTPASLDFVFLKVYLSCHADDSPFFRQGSFCACCPEFVELASYSSKPAELFPEESSLCGKIFFAFLRAALLPPPAFISIPEPPTLWPQQSESPHNIFARG